MASLSKHEDDCGEICCPLPFFLQDLCLFTVICDLDKYPLELLASMPLWLRSRLLKNLPLLDLCRLESTPVAQEVDMSAIWDFRGKPIATENTRTKNLMSFSGLLELSYRKRRSESSFQLNVDVNPSDAVSKEINTAIQQVKKEHPQPGKIDLFIEAVSSILDNSIKLNKSQCESVTLQLTSIPSHLVLSNLRTTSTCDPDAVTHSGSQVVWKKQATAWTVLDLSGIHSTSRSEQIKLRTTNQGSRFKTNQGSGSEQITTIVLVPPRHCMPTVTLLQDELKLLFKLVMDCNLQPSSASIHIDSITRSFLDELSKERSMLDSGIALSPKEVIHTSIVSHLLRKVAILHLQCDKYTKIGIMISMIQAATADGKDSQLKHVFCTLPYLYTDVVQPLATLFSLPNFCQLSLVVDEVYPPTVSNLLVGFMTSPCWHTQTLMIHPKKSVFPFDEFQAQQLCALVTGGDAVPDCGTEHKIFQIFPQDDFNETLYFILQLPTVRLRKVCLPLLSQYFHLSATHRDFQVEKLVIVIKQAVMSFFNDNTVQEDLASFFAMPSLKKMCIYGDWGHIEEFKSGLTKGFRKRRISLLPPLKKVALELRTPNSYKKRDFEMLCDAIFSLSQLDDLKLTLGAGFAAMIRQPGYEDVMYRSWRHKASTKLKVLCFRSYKTEFKKLSIITQNLSFSSKSRESILRRSHDFDSFDSFYFSDHNPFQYYDDYDYDDYDYDAFDY